MKNVIIKYIFRCALLMVILFVITADHKELSAEETVTQTNSRKYTFSYDQEIPTLIRYGDKISGFMSRTGYIGFIQRDDGTSRSSIDIGYNITFYELQEPPSIGRLISIFGLGYVPFLELLTLPGFICDEEDKGAGLGMISPLAGYSYLRQITNQVRLGFSLHGGPVYCGKIQPWSSQEEFDNYFKKQNNEMWYGYDAWVTAYDAIGNISGKWGARINPKIKLFFLNFSDNTVHIGIGIGYTQFVFADNHFNSYDIGLDFMMAF